MQFQGALIKEQGVTFGIILVKESVLNNSLQRDSISKQGTTIFGAIPIILAAQSGSNFKYYGRKDIVDFLASISPSRIPWKKYTVS